MRARRRRNDLVVGQGEVEDVDVLRHPVGMSGVRLEVRALRGGGEPFRGRFRNSRERPEAFVPNQPARVEFEMPDVHHTFRRGHRIMVQVQSTWFPLVDRNPQTFVDIFQATESDFVKATQRVFRSSAMPSHVTFRVMP